LCHSANPLLLTTSLPCVPHAASKSRKSTLCRCATRCSCSPPPCVSVLLQLVSPTTFRRGTLAQRHSCSSCVFLLSQIVSPSSHATPRSLPPHRCIFIWQTVSPANLVCATHQPRSLAHHHCLPILQFRECILPDQCYPPPLTYPLRHSALLIPFTPPCP
jgi:hypothetical protein